MSNQGSISPVKVALYIVMALTFVAVGAAIVVSWQRDHPVGVLQMPGYSAITGSAAGDGQLENGGFEAPYRKIDNIGELQAAEHWWVWFLEDPWHRPEYKAEVPGVGSSRILEGEAAQKQFTTFSRQDGGLFQKIEGLEPGEWYRFKLSGYVWSSSKDDPNVSAGPGKSSLIAGINPWGDCRATYRTTIWGKEALEVYDQWTEVEVIAQTWSSSVCVFTRHVAEWPVKHNDVYWDQATFEPVRGPVDPTLTPSPTASPVTPVPTSTPTPTQVPNFVTFTPTPDPNLPPTPTSTPAACSCDCPTLEEIKALIANRSPVVWPKP